MTDPTHIYPDPTGVERGRKQRQAEHMNSLFLLPADENLWGLLSLQCSPCI